MVKGACARNEISGFRERRAYRTGENGEAAGNEVYRL